MNKYEILYILNVDHEPKNLIEKILAILKLDNGTIKEHNIWGKKDLAYCIKHQNEGYYGVLITQTNPINIKKLQKLNKINKHILRMLVINTAKEKNYIQSTILGATKVTEKTFLPKEHPQKFATQKYNVSIPKDAIIDPNIKILTNINKNQDSKTKIDNKDNNNNKETKNVK